MVARLHLSVVAQLLVCAISEPITLASTCIEGQGPLAERFKQYQAVFLGTVIEMRATELSESAFPADLVLSEEVTFKLREAWKGIDSTSTTVVVNSDVGSSGFPFRFGETYLVAATTRDGRLYAHLCSLTKPWGLATTELLWLRESAAGRSK